MEIWALVMFFVVIAALLLGYPVAFTLGSVSMLFGYIFLGPSIFYALPLRIWGIMTNFTLLAVPLFVFMGVVLEKSGIAEDLLESLGRALGGIRGGLALSTVLVGALLAATTGVVGATVVTMGIIALPTMLKHHYDPALATGTIAAAGTLGQIVPPSIVLILLGDVMGVSIGDLFIGAVVPSAILITSFLLLIAIRAITAPACAPAMQKDVDAPHVSIARLLVTILPPLILVVFVLGSIFFGIASPTESAAIGSLGALILAALHGRLSLARISDAASQTTRLTSMVFMILIGATAFGLVFRGMGGDDLVRDLFVNLHSATLVFVIASMALIFFLGFFLDFIEICFIVVPILAPIAQELGIDLLWFAILIAINLQTSFLTPPFGFSLFYLKAVAPKSLPIATIYRGAVPFVVVQLIVLALLIGFPELTTWLPNLGKS